MSRASSSRPPRLAADPELAELAERIPLDVPELVLGRRVVPDGPTRSYLQGRSVSAQELRRGRLAAGGLLRPARAPQADGGLGAARDPGRVLRRGAPEACAPSSSAGWRQARAIERELDGDAGPARRAGARPRLPRVRDRGDRGGRPGRGRGARARARARPAGCGGDASSRRLARRPRRSIPAGWTRPGGWRCWRARPRSCAAPATATRRSARSHRARRRSCTSWRTSLPSCAPTWARSRRTRGAWRSSRSASSSSRG